MMAVNKDTPLVSIMMPVFNTSSYLQKSIDSIISQTYTNIEIILVDDGSTDGSGAICDRNALNDRRIRVFHTENRGPAEARNLSLDVMRGTYVMFLDSDDWLESRAVQVLTETMAVYDADIATCRSFTEWADHTDIPEKTEELRVLSGKQIIEAYLLDPSISSVPWNKIYRADLFSSVRYPGGKAFEDVATTYRLLLKAKRMVCLSEALVHYRIRKCGILRTNSLKNMCDHWQACYERYLALRGISAECRKNLIGACLIPIGRVWRWYYAGTADERTGAEESVRAMQKFAEGHYSEVMTGRYSVYEKCVCAFARTRNPVLMKNLYLMNRFLRLFRRRREYEE